MGINGFIFSKLYLWLISFTLKQGGVVEHVKSRKCLDVSKKKAEENAVVKPCYGGHYQVWWFENYVHPVVAVKDI